MLSNDWGDSVKYCMKCIIAIVGSSVWVKVTPPLLQFLIYFSFIVIFLFFLTANKSTAVAVLITRLCGLFVHLHYFAVILLCQFFHHSTHHSLRLQMFPRDLYFLCKICQSEAAFTVLVFIASSWMWRNTSKVTSGRWPDVMNLTWNVFFPRNSS